MEAPQIATPLASRALTALGAIAKSHALGPVLVFLGHVAAMQVFHVYTKFPWFDIPMHVLGGFVIARFLWGSLDVLQANSLLDASTGNLRRLLVFALTGTSAVFWEFAEWAYDMATRGELTRTLGDTLSDLALGLVGGVLYLIARTYKLPK